MAGGGWELVDVLGSIPCEICLSSSLGDAVQYTCRFAGVQQRSEMVV